MKPRALSRTRAGSIEASLTKSASDERSERIAKRFEIPMLIAATLVIPAIIIEEAVPGEPLASLGIVLNYAIWLAFLVEAAVMLWVVPNRRQWLREHPLEVIVVLLTPPFLLAFLQPIRLLRLLRLLRFARLAPLVRRLFTAQGLRYTAVLAFLTALAGGAAFHQAEGSRSLEEGFYWAAATMTTVGYGDISPHTTEGRIIAIVVMLVGIGFVALLTGAIARAFIAPTTVFGHDRATAHASSEEDLLARFRALSAQMRELEQALESRLTAETDSRR
jgi:voltage-gated potassium channel